MPRLVWCRGCRGERRESKGSQTAQGPYDHALAWQRANMQCRSSVGSAVWRWFTCGSPGSSCARGGFTSRSEDWGGVVSHTSRDLFPLGTSLAILLRISPIVSHTHPPSHFTATPFRPIPSNPRSQALRSHMLHSMVTLLVVATVSAQSTPTSCCAAVSVSGNSAAQSARSPQLGVYVWDRSTLHNGWPVYIYDIAPSNPHNTVFYLFYSGSAGWLVSFDYVNYAGAYIDSPGSSGCPADTSNAWRYFGQGNWNADGAITVTCLSQPPSLPSPFPPPLSPPLMPPLPPVAARSWSYSDTPCGSTYRGVTIAPRDVSLSRGFCPPQYDYTYDCGIGVECAVICQGAQVEIRRFVTTSVSGNCGSPTTFGPYDLNTCITETSVMPYSATNMMFLSCIDMSQSPYPLPPPPSPPPPSSLLGSFPSFPPPPTAPPTQLCSVYSPGTATVSCSSSSSSIHGVTRTVCSPVGCQLGCPDYVAPGYSQQPCPSPPPSPSPPSPPPPSPPQSIGSSPSPSPPPPSPPQSIGSSSSPSPPSADASPCDAANTVCCHDGPNGTDYTCNVGMGCGKGQCLVAGSFLCIDAGDYVCPSGTSCGRGVCVPAGRQLCGSSGTTSCLAGTTCCGTSASTRNSEPFTCRNSLDPCPLDYVSDTSYIATPYVYEAGQSGSSSSATPAIMGGVVGGLGVVAAVLVAVHRTKRRRTPTKRLVELTPSAGLTAAGSCAVEKSDMAKI